MVGETWSLWADGEEMMDLAGMVNILAREVVGAESWDLGQALGW